MNLLDGLFGERSVRDRGRGGGDDDGLILLLLFLCLPDGLGGEDLHGFVGDDEVEDDRRRAPHAVPGAQDQDDTVAEGLFR